MTNEKIKDFSYTKHSLVKRKLVLHFPKKTIDQPITYKLVKDYNLVFNILKAKIDNEQEEGLLVIELSGKDEDYAKGIDYLESLGIKLQPLEKDIERDLDKCTHCSACVVHCPTGALFVKDRKTMEVEFDKEKCILCEACIPVCPFGAMKIEY
ncbi:MAG: 4Fe-4S binding protein [Nanoarchaeota archaeon]|nr:4Fe-4S binding protein [Nanoarchaeota archaeon]MBU1005946.1 4Fe-4S binding protein [Nanoarchaeota archaeon]MBU1947073.1 4Fe-4S binding protein [Nanoarchaeota archaeon]